MQNMCSGKGPLQVANEQEALYLACEMERRAIRLYERGETLARDPDVQALMHRLLGDEKKHLARFCHLGDASMEGGDRERQLLMQSYAAQVLFPGGLIKAQREGALDSLEALLLFARDSEETAVRSYTSFASACKREEAGEMFLAIATEEQAHLTALEEQLNMLK